MAHQVDVCSAIDIFQNLAGMATTAALFDAMVHLALDYAEGPQAWIVMADRVEAYATSLQRQAGDAAHAALPVLLTQALQRPPTPGLPTVIEQQGSTALAFAVAGACGQQHAYLCVMQGAAPSSHGVQTLTLIAACGGALFESRADRKI